MRRCVMLLLSPNQIFLALACITQEASPEVNGAESAFRGDVALPRTVSRFLHLN